MSRRKNFRSKTIRRKAPGQNARAETAAPAAEGKVVWRLVQIPKIEGAIAVMDPHTGRVLAVVGGFSYAASQFDRAVQAKRQPGSSFKPIVYAAAMDNGYTPSSIVLDAPMAIEQGRKQRSVETKGLFGQVLWSRPRCGWASNSRGT